MFWTLPLRSWQSAISTITYYPGFKGKVVSGNWTSWKDSFYLGWQLHDHSQRNKPEI